MSTKPYTKELLFTKLPYENGYSVSTGSAAEAAELVIPAVYDGLAVLELGDLSAATAEGLTLPSSLVRITGPLPACLKSVFITDLAAFSAIEVPEGDSVFGGASLYVDGESCEELRLHGMKKIQPRVFSGFSNLRRLVLGSEVEEVLDGAFRATGLEEVSMKGVVRIAPFAFADNKALYQVTLNDGLVEVCEGAFQNCLEMGTVRLPGTVHFKAEDAFPGGTWVREEEPVREEAHFVLNEDYNFRDDICSIKSLLPPYPDVLYIPAVYEGKKVISVGKGAFSRLPIRAVIFEDGVQSIWEEAFSHCENLVSVFFPQNELIDVYDHAFEDCTALSSLTLTKKCRFKNGVTAGCTSLMTLKVSEDCAFISDHNCIIHILSDKSGYLVTGCNGSSRPDYEPITSIQAQAFCRCERLKEFGAGGVKYVNEGAFFGCTSLRKIDISPEYMFDRIFENCESLVSVDFPELISLDNEVFSGCRSLETVRLPKCHTVGTRIFSHCDSLKSITMDDSYFIQDNCLINNPSKKFPRNKLVLALKGAHLPEGLALKEIGPWAFEDHSDLTEVVVPEGVTMIGDGAFFGCSGIKRLSLPKSLVMIGVAAFAGCSSLESIVIPEQVDSIGRQAFSGCSALSSIEFKNADDWRAEGAGHAATVFDATNPEEAARLLMGRLADYTVKHWDGPMEYRKPTQGLHFQKGEDGCYTVVSLQQSGTVESICVPATHQGAPVKTVGDKCFKGYGMKGIRLMDGIREIGTHAFLNCTELETLYLPASLEAIGSGAFFGCTALKKLELPGNVKTIEADAFAHCDALEEVLLPSALEPPLRGIFSYRNMGIETLRLEDSNPYFTLENGCLIEKENGRLVATADLYTLPDDGSLKIIGAGAFRGRSYLTEIHLPDSVTEIEDEAFLDCTTLETVTLGAGLARIGDRAFRGCRALREISLPEGLESIGEMAFAETGLTELTLPSSLRRIGLYAFVDLSLTSALFLGQSGWYWEEEQKEADPVVRSCRAEMANPREMARLLTQSQSGAFYRKREEVDLEEDSLGGLQIEDDMLVRTGVFDGECLVIPDTFHGKPLTSIGENAFRDLSERTVRVVLPATVRSILPQAAKTVRFRELSIQEPASFLSIHHHGEGLPLHSLVESLLLNGEPLTELSVPGKLRVVRPNFLRNVRGIRRLTLEEKLERIEASAFEGCQGLLEVTLPSTLEVIGERAFADCSSLTRIVIPEGVSYIAGSAFAGCTALSEIVFEKTGGWFHAKDEESRMGWPQNVKKPAAMAEYFKGKAPAALKRKA